MHPLNKNQLYYPGFNNAGGSGDPNGGTPILSTDFGDWKDLPEKSTDIFDEQILIQYKLDLANYPTKAIVYLVGQFGLNPIFSGTEMMLGILPEDTRPKHRIKQNFTVQATECYLIIETTGEVLLFAVSGDLPVTIGETENDPYFINIDYNPDISDGTIVEEYTAVRSQNFTRNNCENGYAGSTVLFTKTYKSTISQQAANDIADGDVNFVNQGQEFANDPENGSCTVIAPVSYYAQRTQSFSRNDCAAGEVGSALPFTKNYSSLLSQADADQKAANDPDFETLGQAYANDPLNGATCTVMSGGETTYYAQRSQSFTRNNCGGGSAGSSIPFTKNYSSIVSQQAANDLAASDENFAIEGQAFVNNPTNGATCTVYTPRHFTLNQYGRRLNLEGGVAVGCPINLSVIFNITAYDFDGNNPVTTGPYERSLTLNSGTQGVMSDPITAGLYDTIDLSSWTFSPKYCGNKQIFINGQPGEDGGGLIVE